MDNRVQMSPAITGGQNAAAEPSEEGMGKRLPIKNRVNELDVSFKPIRLFTNHLACYREEQKLPSSFSTITRKRCNSYVLSAQLLNITPPRLLMIFWRRWSRTSPILRKTIKSFRPMISTNATSWSSKWTLLFRRKSCCSRTVLPWTHAFTRSRVRSAMSERLSLPNHQAASHIYL